MAYTVVMVIFLLDNTGFIQMDNSLLITSANNYLWLLSIKFIDYSHYAVKALLADV